MYFTDHSAKRHCVTDFSVGAFFLQFYSETYTCIGAIVFADFELIALGTKPNTCSFGD